MKVFFPLLFFVFSLHASPSFMVIGTAKGGTTSLYHYLNQHPLITMPKRKELHFFDTKKYQRGIEYYLTKFPREDITGDVTPRYMPASWVPQRVSAHFPDIKIIVLLRNPVDRAFSHYKQQVYPKSHQTFEHHIKKEMEQLRTKGKHIGLVLLQRGFYAEQLRNWLRYFPKEQFLILKSEDFFKNTQETMDKIFAFLGLPPHHYPSFSIRNKGSLDHLVLKPETRKMLERFYRPYNKQLQSLFDELGLGITLDWD